MKKILAISFVYTCLTTSLASAQSYYFRNYEVNEGLSSNTVTCIAQDESGFMWFGTRNGLNRFDGNAFKVFRNNPKDSMSIGNNSILSLFGDKDKKLWVGTYKGVYIYDALHETFSLFPLVPRSEVRSIGKDKSNNTWFAIGYGVYKYNPVKNLVTYYNISTTQIPVISFDSSGSVWIGGDFGIVKKYEAASDTFTDYPITADAKGKQAVFFQTIYSLTDSTLLIATLKQVLLFNIKNLSIKNIFKEKPWANNIQVHKIIRQSDSLIWFGTENGLYSYNLNNGNSELVQKQYDNPYSINDNVITDFCKDSEGNMWVGTFFGGINYFSKEMNEFQKYFHATSFNSLSGNLVHEICTDKTGNLWVGTEDAGLNKIDKKTGLIKHFLPGTNKGSISYQNIHGLLADGNELWIGTYEHGLDVLDLTTEKVVRHYEKSEKANSLNSNFIVTIYKTREGKILIGTWEGLFEFNREKNNFKSLPFFNRQAQAIYEDQQGTLWVCSYGNGVYFYNERTGEKGSFVYSEQNRNSIPNNYVNNLFEDSKRNIWFCTESGLCRYDYNQKTIIRYTDEPSLNNNQIFRVVEDNNGMLWISTSKGLVRMNPNNNKIRVYTVDNGLLSNQFNYNSAFKREDGRMYFGTGKGMISFDPNHFAQNNFVPPVFITGLQVNNQDFQESNRKILLNMGMSYLKDITLNYDHSNINIEVAALSYQIPAMNEYAYKMEGLEKDWTMIKNNRRLYYTKLPPGHYIFKIKGSNNDGVWNNKETTLNIHILSPYWANICAYIFYVLLSGAILFIILHNYYAALKEKSQRKIKELEIEKEREIYIAKIEFFTNVTHEIRTPLTLIKLPVEKLMDTVSNDSLIFENLVMIEKNTNRLIQLTDQLLDFRKAEANNYSLSFVRTDIIKLLVELFETYLPIAKEKSISFKLNYPRVPLMAYVDPEAFRKLLSNLFSNSVKYAEHNITARLMPYSSDDTDFSIEFKNDGYIIPSTLKEKIFEPFYRIKQTEKTEGTGIGLSLSRTLAELHNGKLSLDTQDPKINTFLLKIPIHQETEIHLVKDESEIAIVETGIPGEFPVHENDISILLVEDNNEILNFLYKELKNHYNIFKSSNGQQALEVLNTENIDLIISDIMMPVMDGIEFCKKIKTDLHYSHVPVILLTAKNTLSSKIEGLETGADAYIEKPFVMKYLMAQITNLLANRQHIKEYYAHSPLAHMKGIACTNADKYFIEDLQKKIDENIISKDLDVDAISRMMNMSRGTFYRKIKGLSNLTPNELITLSRLKKAVELLTNGNHKISEVANIIGYSLQSNFARDFHKQFGISPTGYINKLKNEKKTYNL